MLSTTDVYRFFFSDAEEDERRICGYVHSSSGPTSIMVACCGKSDESSTERRGVHRRSPKAKQKDDEGGVELEGVKLLQPKIHFGGEEDEPSVSSSRDDTEARQRKAAAAGGTGHIDASGEQLEWLNRAVGAAGEIHVRVVGKRITLDEGKTDTEDIIILDIMIILWVRTFRVYRTRKYYSYGALYYRKFFLKLKPRSVCT